MADQDHIYKHSLKLKKAQKKANTAKSKLKKAKATLADDVKKHKASDDLAAKSFIVVHAAKANMNADLQELAEIKCWPQPWCFDECLIEASTRMRIITQGRWPSCAQRSIKKAGSLV